MKFAKSPSLLTLSSLAACALANPTPQSAPNGDSGLSMAEKEAILMGSFDAVSISEWSYYYTHGLHLAGTNRSQAEWTRDRWIESGVKANLVTYNVLMSYPVSHSLSLTYPNGTVINANLEEDVLPADITTGFPDRVPSFHGYSFTGSATAEYVFVGRGHRTDFERLVQLGVQLEGKIAIVQYGPQLRGLKVRNAQAFGMIGAIIYVDPGDDGPVRVENGYLAYPDGPARNPSSVQRGSVEFFTILVGDPTTPGYPSKPGVARQDTTLAMPQIPSLPMSFREARPLLEALNGHGISAAEVNIADWSGGLSGVSYSTGPAPGAKITMNNVMEEKYTDIWDVIGVINGTIADEVIVIGNHRDAWIVGGAADPNSASAVLVELTRAFKKLIDSGWKPLRTIVFASWDAEEYGMVGSTEWLEEYITWADPNVVAYLNIDIAAAGGLFALEAAPELHDLIFEVMKKVPHGRDKSKSIYDVWTSLGSQIGVLGCHSDYTSFVQAGISSIDISYGPGGVDPVYHYHSNYDSFHWMTQYGDPTFSTHVSTGQVLALLALNLIDKPLIPLNVSTFTDELRGYYQALLQTLAASGLELDLEPVRQAVEGFATITDQLTPLSITLATDDSRLKEINTRVKRFGRGFITQGGLPNREFYKNLIYSPAIDVGYHGVTFPGITEALQVGDLETAKEFVPKTANAIWQSTAILAVGEWKGEGADYSQLAF